MFSGQSTSPKRCGRTRMPLKQEPVRPGLPRRGETQPQRGERQLPPPATPRTRSWLSSPTLKRPRQTQNLPRQTLNLPTLPRPGQPQQMHGRQQLRCGEQQPLRLETTTTRQTRCGQKPPPPTLKPKPLRQLPNLPTLPRPGQPQQTHGEQQRKRGEQQPLRLETTTTRQTRCGQKPPPPTLKPKPLRQLPNLPTLPRPGQPQQTHGEQQRKRGEQQQMRPEPPVTEPTSATGFATRMPQWLWLRHCHLSSFRASFTTTTRPQLTPTLFSPKAEPPMPTRGARTSQPKVSTRPTLGATPQRPGEPQLSPHTTPTTQHSPPTPKHGPPTPTRGALASQPGTVNTPDAWRDAAETWRTAALAAHDANNPALAADAEAMGRLCRRAERSPHSWNRQHARRLARRRRDLANRSNRRTRRKPPRTCHQRRHAGRLCRRAERGLHG